MIFSSTFLKTGSKEIDLYLSTSVLLPNLNSGITLALFRQSGNSPWLNFWYINFCRFGTTARAEILKTSAERTSLPDALPILGSAIEPWISSNDVHSCGYKYMLFKVRSDWNSSTDIADIDVETRSPCEAKLWLKKSARLSSRTATLCSGSMMRTSSLVMFLPDNLFNSL